MANTSVEAGADGTDAAGGTQNCENNELKGRELHLDGDNSRPNKIVWWIGLSA